MKFKKYRIVTDSDNKFTAQIWRLFFTFWVEIGCCNTFDTVEEAESFITGRVVKYVQL